jgi:hypothetical protein
MMQTYQEHTRHPPSFCGSVGCLPSVVCCSVRFFLFCSHLSEDEPYHFRRSQSLRTTPGAPLPFAHDRKYEGFGGFPGPVDLFNKVLKHAAPSTYQRLERSMTVPYTTMLEGQSEPWLKFDGLVVGRNSDFRTETLSSDHIKDIGGTEYRALVLLSWLVPVVCFFL